MKKLLAVLVAFGLMTTVNVAASDQSEPFISECHNLDDNQVPEGWTQELWYGGPGVYDGALRAFPNDGLGKLWKQGVLPDGAVGIRFEYDANIAYSYWGIINQIFIKLSSGVAYLVRSEMSDIHNGMVTSAKIIRFDGGSEVPDTTYQWDYPFETTSYHYTVTFYDGSIEYKAEKLGDGSILFDLSVEDPYLDISAIDTIAFMVRAKTDNKAWMDNLCVEIIGGEMICDAFLTPQRLAIHNTVMGLPKIAPRAEDTRNRNRHSFKIHLLPCEPMDVSVGDSAEVYVDVDESGEYDDDEQYPAVVSSTDQDGEATDIAIKVFVGDDLIDNDPLVAIDAVGGLMIVDADGNRIDYLQLDTFTPGDGGLMAGDELVPSAFELHQNYPNPFNPATEIRFSLSEAAEARLEVYNILGQTVAVLVDEWLAAGTHIVKWNTEDSRGQSLGSGIYFYRLTAQGSTENKTMVLLK